MTGKIGNALRRIIETALADAYREGAKDWDQSAGRYADGEWQERQSAFVKGALQSYLGPAIQSITSQNKLIEEMREALIEIDEMLPNPKLPLTVAIKSVVANVLRKRIMNDKA